MLLKRFCVASERGSLTIETAIIFSIVFFMVIALIYTAMLMYQYAYLQSLASKAAQRGAAIYPESCKDMFTGSIYVSDMLVTDPYDSIFNSQKDTKDSKVGNYIKTQVSTYSLFEQGQPKITVESMNYIFYQKIRVTVRADYKLPAGNLLKVFGLSSSFPVTASSEAVVDNPAEFIRNTDFISETASGIISEANSGSGMDFKNNLSKALGKITSLFKK